MRLLALDISATNTGCAFGIEGAAPVLRSVSLTSQNSGETCAKLMKWVSARIKEYEPDQVIIEAALLVANSGASADTARLALEMAGCVKATVWLRIGKATHEVPVQTWRKSFLGRGRFGKEVDAGGKKTSGGQVAKREALAMCKRLGWETLGEDDRAEAAGVYAHGCLFLPNAPQKIMRETLAGARR